MMFTQTHAAQFTRITLDHVAREYPNALQHVIAAPGDWAGPRALHPIFFGSFDWHSCVHAYWTLARCLRRFPDRPECADVRALFERSFTPEKVAAEIAYFERPTAAAFERTYGWAWLLKLQAELLQHDAAWAQTLQPFASYLAARLTAYLAIATYPIRAGTHANGAFALRLAFDYANISQDAALAATLRAKAESWFVADAAAQAFEPSQDDFLSPTLMTAEAMRRVGAQNFAAWFATYLPRLATGEPSTLFTPALPSLRSDGKIAHLDGLNLSRAWCWKNLAHAHPAITHIAAETAQTHLAASLPHLADDYAGAHWLQTFALLALDD